MDINNSTISGNICAVVDLLAQGGFHVANKSKPEENDLEDHVVLFHGDSGTGEHLQAIQQRQAIEETPWNWFQHVIFVPGLFHLKMAAVDGLRQQTTPEVFSGSEPSFKCYDHTFSDL
ncbi:hypothetical protein SERLA73DRAFT_154750 [Serpula lacrymans var. lacrymans S7.3]|uniref:DUF6589 domain-containing protein n=1 Tax=Serpula lacrymans var. lacrymans (strain S7.3) TaxID=936435 RepID=F8Q5G0_SERL3|nr:hypothetical protein SERLA73DRAFT_154750 [Serpula lacrymans var. lacrymans S7.3]